MMNYMIVEGLEKLEMQDEVAKFLADGWKLEGQLVVLHVGGNTFRFFQAMIKHIPGTALSY